MALLHRKTGRSIENARFRPRFGSFGWPDLRPNDEVAGSGLMAQQRSRGGEMEGKHFFIRHIADKVEAMEAGRTRLKPVIYRVHARMLREALAGCPEQQLDAALGISHPAVREALSNRFFENTGYLRELPATAAKALKREADLAISRLRRVSQ
jgi:hypothetical protein